jgi:hypothetical protein
MPSAFRVPISIACPADAACTATSAAQHNTTAAALTSSAEGDRASPEQSHRDRNLTARRES